jgi:hypothetical protein
MDRPGTQGKTADAGDVAAAAGADTAIPPSALTHQSFEVQRHFHGCV